MSLPSSITPESRSYAFEVHLELMRARNSKKVCDAVCSVKDLMEAARCIAAAYTINPIPTFSEVLEIYDRLVY
jgi:hypothetical protein